MCKDCDRQFVGGERIDDSVLEDEYIDGKQTLAQLAAKYGVCQKTVWNRLESMRHKRKISKDKDVVILMDTTYWGRKFGLVVIKDAFRNKVLWFKFIRRKERISDYREGVEWLKNHGFRIWGMVVDGLRGIFQEFRGYPVQMCQYHMIEIVKRYLTSKPDLAVSQELLALTKTLADKSKDEFTHELEEWHSKWKEVIQEAVKDKEGKKHYVRPRLRSAYQALKRHFPWLWTFEKYSDRVIPNTNAGIESLNSKLKTIMRVHSGITADRREKLLENYIAKNY